MYSYSFYATGFSFSNWLPSYKDHTIWCVENLICLITSNISLLKNQKQERKIYWKRRLDILEMNYTQNLTEIEFNTTSGEFGPIKIFNWEGAIRIIWIILFGFSALITFIANFIPIHFITKQPSETRRPIDILLLYDQVSFFVYLKVRLGK